MTKGDNKLANKEDNNKDTSVARKSESGIITFF